MAIGRFFFVFVVLAAMLVGVAGCGSSGDVAFRCRDAFGSMKEINRSNAAKVRTCYVIFESRHDRSPVDKEELLEFLRGGSVDKNLKRIDISKDAIEDIFVSERDGKPLKVRWGIEMDPERTMPIAFEEEGVGGVRLVAADVVVEVRDDIEYEKMWNGDYVTEAERFWVSDTDDLAP